jgi:hypothetical protein
METVRLASFLGPLVLGLFEIDGSETERYKFGTFAKNYDIHGITKRYRLFGLAHSALVYDR